MGKRMYRAMYFLDPVTSWMRVKSFKPMPIYSVGALIIGEIL
jgi:hypothetical protein